MGKSGSSGRHVRARNESPLFYTPPADEKFPDLEGFFDDKGQGASGGATPNAGYHGRMPACLPANSVSNPPAQKKGHRILECFPLDPASLGPTYSDTQLLEADLWDCGLENLHLSMAPTGGSLTSFVDPFSGVSAPERTHLSDGKTRESHLRTLTSPKTTATLLTTVKPKPFHNFQSLGSFAGYATSEEEEQERTPVRRIDKARPKKVIAYKSAETIASSSSGDSKPDQSQSQHSLNKRGTLAKPSKRVQESSSHLSPNVSKLNRNTISKRRSQMTYDRRGNGNAARQNGATAQKRARSPTNMLANKKRPNTKGGFIVDDSESEPEDDDMQVTDKRHIRSRPAPPEPAPKKPPLGCREESKPIIEPGVAPLPTRNVNRNRIIALLGKNKSAQNTPEQRMQASQTRPTNTKPPVSVPPGHSPGFSVIQHRTMAKTDSTRMDVSREQCSPTVYQMKKEMEGPSQESKASGTQKSMLNNDRKACNIHINAEQPATLDRLSNHKRNSPQASPKPAPSITAAPGKQRTPQMQQRKPLPGANITKERTNGTANGRLSQASQPKSHLQNTLDDAKSATPIAAPRQPDAGGGERKQDARNNPSTLPSPSVPKSGSGPKPRIEDRCLPSSSESQIPRTPQGGKSAVTAATQSMSKVQNPGTPAANSVQAQQQRASATSGPKASLLNARSIFAPSPKTTSVQIAQTAHKRKADNISGGPGHPTAPSKRPAVTPTSPSIRTADVQAQPKGAAASRAPNFPAPKILARSMPTEAEKLPTSIKSVAGTTSNPYLASSPGPQRAIVEACSAAAYHAPQKEQNVHAATSSDKRSSPEVINPTPTTGDVAVNDDGALPTKSAPPMARQDIISDTVQVQSVPQIPGQAIGGALPDQTTALIPQQVLEVQASTPAPVPSSVGAAQILKQPASPPYHASTSLSEDKPIGGGHKGAAAQLPAPVPALAIIAEETSPTAAATSSDKPGEVLTVRSGTSDTSPSTATKAAPTEMSGAKAPIVDKEHGSTDIVTAPTPTSSKASNSSRSGGSGTSKPELPASPQPVDHISGTPRVAQVPGDSLKDTARSNIASLEARKKPKPDQQEKKKAASQTSVDTKTVNNVGSSDQPSFLVGGMDTSSIVIAKPSFLPIDAPKDPKAVLTPPLSPPVASAAFPAATPEVGREVLELSHFPEVSSDAQPYFEYSVFQKMWSSEQSESDVAATEITVRSFTNINEANAQAERVFQGSKEQYAHHLLVDWINKRDKHGCSVFVGTISPFDWPAKKSHLKIYVQRNCVSKFANQTPQALRGTTFISNTGYTLRLVKVISTSDAGDSDDSDAEEKEEEDRPLIRAYHAHSRPEFYTTLEAANRAARSLQIELSHEKNPTDVMTRAFQEKNLAELNAKVLALESPDDGEEGCWKSKFNASGLGGDSLELVVEKAGICGPRNI